MKIKKVELRNFRNFEEIKVSLNPTCNIFLGENGQGKTNFIESIYFLSRGEGFRPSKLSTFVNFKYPSLPAVARADVSSANKDFKIQIAISENKKSILLNDKKTNATELVKNFSAVLFSPESLAAIKSGSQERRDLLDEMVLLHQPQNFRVISQFRKVLRTRNRILKDHLAGKISPAEFFDLFESVSEPYLQAATDLTHARLVAIGAIQNEFNQHLNSIFSFPVAAAITYIVSDRNISDFQSPEIYDALIKRAQQLRAAEIASGTSLIGPHRHEANFVYNGKDARYYCSQGQQRSLILALKISQIMYHYRVFQKYPVLLLDDVLSELDLGKKMNLMELVSQLNAQVFITSTDQRFREFMKKDKYTVFEMKDGTLVDRND